MQLLDTSRIQEISASIIRMSDIVDLTKSQYPYLPLTFSIWRKQKYQDLKIHTDSSLLRCLTLKFHQEVDRKLLPIFVAKVKEGIKDSFKALRVPSATRLKQIKEQGEYDSLITQYIQAATGQLYRLQILSDLLTLPYGLTIKESYYLRKQYTTYQELGNEGIIVGLFNKHGKTVVSKGLSALGSQLWGRVALLVVGGMNIVGLAGGVMISQTVDLIFSKLSKNKRKQKLEQQIIKFNANSNILQVCIRKCTQIVQRFIKAEDQSEKKQLQQYWMTQLQKVFIFDSEDTITIVDMDKGWKMIEKKDSDQSFELIRDQQNEQIQEKQEDEI